MFRFQGPRISYIVAGVLAFAPCGRAQYTQQAKLVGSGATTGGGCQGSPVSLSADGNTAVVGGQCDNNFFGAFWIFTRSAGAWSQVGGKMVNNQAFGGSQQGTVAISGDGNTIVNAVAGDRITDGEAFIFIRNANGAWSQQGPALQPNDAAGYSGFGSSAALSSDGNTAIIGGTGDNGGLGAAWVFKRTNGQWAQQGSKLTGNDAVINSSFFGVLQGVSVGISSDGNTAIVGGDNDNNQLGAAWIYVRGSNGAWTQQGPKLVGSATTAIFQEGTSVAISGDGNTAALGAPIQDGVGAVWIFTRSGGVWTQQGPKLVGAGASGAALQGRSEALSMDGNTLLVGGPADNKGVGAAWIFTRANGGWTQKGNKLVGSGAVGGSDQGESVALSADGTTALVGGDFDNNNAGATWVFGLAPASATHLNVTAPPAATAGSPVTVNVTALDSNNNTFGAYSGTVHLTSSDKAAALPADGTLQSGVGAFPVTFNTAGSQTVTATDTAVSTIAGTSGAVTVTAPSGGVPTAGGTNLGGGTGMSTTITFSFNDTAGYQNLHVVDILINSVLDGRHACYIAFVPSGQNSGALDLVDDSGDAGGPYSFTILPGSGTVSNSQCTVSGSASGAGNTLNLTLNITFSASFAGNKVFYLSAGDQSGANSNWQALATWNVPGGAAAGPTVTGVAPARTSRLGPTTYTFTFADTAGFQDAASIENIIINSAIDGRHACFLAFQPSSNSLFLVDDAGDAAGPYQGLTLPASASIGNSQCTINGGSSVARNGKSLTLTLSLSFTQSFAGNQIIFMAARNSTANSGWQAAGSVTVP